MPTPMPDRHHTLGLLAAGVGALALAACGSGSGSHVSSHSVHHVSRATTTTGATTKVSCTFTPAPDNTGGKNPGLPPQPGPGPTRATFTTSVGNFVIHLDAAKAPCTTSSFRHLAQTGFFNGTHCHRLTTQGIYVLQCGDPTGTGTGGPGYTIPDENLSGATYTAGTVAMANTGQPHSGGSQFFIVYKASPLPPSYTPFGTVTSGLSVIDKVAAAGSDNTNGPGDGAPKRAVNIQTVKMS